MKRWPEGFPSGLGCPATPAAYLGGKKQIAARTAPMLEQIPHNLYAKPFVGMGGVFLRRSLIPKAEVINDRSGDVITLFRIVSGDVGPLLLEVPGHQSIEIA